MWSVVHVHLQACAFIWYMHMHMYAFHRWCTVTWDSTGVRTCVAALINDVITLHSSAPSNGPNTP